MFAQQLAHSSTRVLARQMPLAGRRGFAVATRPKAMSLIRSVPVEVYPLMAVLTFACTYGVVAGVKAWMKEPEHFAHHTSTGAPSMKY